MIKILPSSFFVLLFFYCISSITAQVSINSGANSISGESIVMDYTIGEAIHQTISNSEWVIIAGIQQDYEVYVDTRIDNTLVDIDINLYPNPAVHYVELSFGENLECEYEAVFYNTSGQMVKRFQINESISRLEIGDVASGTYILQVKDSEAAVVKMFKIIKK